MATTSPQWQHAIRRLRASLSGALAGGHFGARLRTQLFAAHVCRLARPRFRRLHAFGTQAASRVQSRALAVVQGLSGQSARLFQGALVSGGHLAATFLPTTRVAFTDSLGALLHIHRSAGTRQGFQLFRGRLSSPHAFPVRQQCRRRGLAITRAGRAGHGVIAIVLCPGATLVQVPLFPRVQLRDIFHCFQDAAGKAVRAILPPRSLQRWGVMCTSIQPDAMLDAASVHVQAAANVLLPAGAFKHVDTSGPGQIHLHVSSPYVTSPMSMQTARGHRFPFSGRVASPALDGASSLPFLPALVPAVNASTPGTNGGK